MRKKFEDVERGQGNDGARQRKRITANLRKETDVPFKEIAKEFYTTDEDTGSFQKRRIMSGPLTLLRHPGTTYSISEAAGICVRLLGSAQGCRFAYAPT